MGGMAWKLNCKVNFLHSPPPFPSISFLFQKTTLCPQKNEDGSSWNSDLISHFAARTSQYPNGKTAALYSTHSGFVARQHFCARCCTTAHAQDDRRASKQCDHRIWVFWKITLCRWGVVCDVSKQPSGSIFKCQEVQPLKMKALRPFETSGIARSTTQLNIPGDLNRQTQLLTSEGKNSVHRIFPRDKYKAFIRYRWLCWGKKKRRSPNITRPSCLPLGYLEERLRSQKM